MPTLTADPFLHAPDTITNGNIWVATLKKLDKQYRPTYRCGTDFAMARKALDHVLNSGDTDVNSIRVYVDWETDGVFRQEVATIDVAGNVTFTYLDSSKHTGYPTYIKHTNRPAATLAEAA